MFVRVIEVNREFRRAFVVEWVRVRVVLRSSNFTVVGNLRFGANYTRLAVIRRSEEVVTNDWASIATEGRVPNILGVDFHEGLRFVIPWAGICASVLVRHHFPLSIAK